MLLRRDTLNRVKGKVVDNKDPKKLGRVKVFIRGLMEMPKAEDLPWSYPDQSSMSGTSPTQSNFSVPDLETEVSVTFPFGGERAVPVYGGSINSEKTSAGQVFEDQYPKTEGEINSLPELSRTNKYTQTNEYIKPKKGDLVQKDGDGNWVFNIPGNLHINVEKDVIINVEGDINILSKGAWALKVNGTLLLDSSRSMGFKTGASIIHEAAGTIADKAPKILHNSGGPSPPVWSDKVTSVRNKIKQTVKKLSNLVKESQTKYKNNRKGIGT